jgi:hypothetical protein
MKKLVSLSIFVFVSAFAFAQTYVFTPTEDCSVGFHDYYNSANTNYGNAIYYGAFSQPGASGGENAGMGLMKFDLSQFPAGTVITSATLDLYGSGPFGGGDAAEVGNIGKNTSYLERITSAWDENVVTYNTQPSATYQHRAKLKRSTTFNQDYLGIDVTKMIQDMLDDPANSFGIRIRLRSEEPTRGMSFVSTDGGDANKIPVLTIVIQGQKLADVLPAPQVQQSISVYPNPAVDQMTIDLSQIQEPVSSIRILDISGSVFLEKKIENDSQQLKVDVSNLHSGIYLLEMITPSGRKFSKFEVQK